MKVVIQQPISEPGTRFLRDRGYQVMVGDGNTDPAALREAVRDADGLVVRTAFYTRQVLEAAPRLKVIARMGVGLDNVDLDYCRERGIWVTIAPGANSNAVAEHTMGFLVDCAHRITWFDRQVRRGNWEARNTLPGGNLKGKTLGVVGLGRIGRLVAQKAAAAFDMRVIGYHPRWSAAQYPAGVEPAPSLEKLLAEADYVSLHVPSTPETHHMADAAFFAKMKPGASFLNLARGVVVDEAALADALRSGRIAFAALDVLEQEPPPMDHPFFGLENLVLTPHTATLNRETMDAMSLDAAAGADDVLSGRIPEWPVIRP